MPVQKKAVQKKQDEAFAGDFVEFAAEPQPESLMDDELFQGEAQDTSRHTLAGDPIAADQTDSIGVDRRYSTPNRQIKGSAEEASVGGDSGLFMEALVNKMIAAKVDELIEAAGSKLLSSIGSQPFVMQQAPPPQPPSYLHHYRCDTHPDLQILELDMGALDRGERPQANPIPGSWIRFRRGHLYLTDSEEDLNKARQIEWMRGRPATSSDGQSTLGGNQSIYEDDGGDIFRCTAGCDYITASKNAWKAHMMSTHGITVN